MRRILSLTGALVLLAGCSTYTGGTGSEYTTSNGIGEGNPSPAASPTFRPGMNPEDVRDPHFTTRPEATQSQPPPP